MGKNRKNGKAAVVEEMVQGVAEVVEIEEIAPPVEEVVAGEVDLTAEAKELKEKLLRMKKVIKDAVKVEEKGDAYLADLEVRAKLAKDKVPTPTPKTVEGYKAKITAIEEEFNRALAVVREYDAKVAETKKALGIKAPRTFKPNKNKADKTKKLIFTKALAKKGWNVADSMAMAPEKFGNKMIEFAKDGWQMKNIEDDTIIVDLREYGKGSMKLIEAVLG